MKNNTKISLALAGVILLQSIGGNLAYAASDAEVSNWLQQNPGASDAQIRQAMDQYGVGVDQLSRVTGVNTTEVQSRYNAVVPVPVTPAAISGPTGTVIYNGQNVQVTNGRFTLNGKSGTIDAQGNFVYDGQTGNILTTAGVTSYKIQGQEAVSVDTSTHRTVSGINRNGAYSNVDIDFLAQSMKNGTFDVNNQFIKFMAMGLKFSEAEVKEFQDFVNSHTTKEIADKIASLPVESILRIDEMRPSASVGAAMRVDPWYLSRHILSHPESWQNVLEHAGIPFTQADLDKLYKGTQADMVAWLATLTNDKFERVQAFVYNSTDTMGKPYFNTGWDDLPGYSPELGRVVSPAEKDAISRIRFYTINMYFVKPGGHGDLTPTGSGKVVPNTNGLWKSDAFKEYLTPAAIADFIANPEKGTFAGGTGGNIRFGDGITTAGGSIGGSGVSGQRPSTTSTGVIGVAQIHPRASDNMLSSNNPYAGSFSAANINTLNTWISTKIRAKENTMTAANYSTFINTLATKIATLKNSMTDQTKIAILNYILYEVTTIQNGLSNDTSFLDDLLR